MLCFVALPRNAARLRALRRYARFVRARSLFRYLVKFNADAVRTASVARAGVGRGGAGAPRNSERRPLTEICIV